MGFFRESAINDRRRSLYGSVVVQQPLAMPVLTGLAVVILIIAVCFVVFAEFSRKESAPGWTVPDQGIVHVLPPQGSRVSRMLVEVGDAVREGQIVAMVTAEAYGPGGGVSNAEQQQAREQLREIDGQIGTAVLKDRARTIGLASKKAAVAAIVQSLRSQKKLQDRQLMMAQTDYESGLTLSERGFVSRTELNRRESAMLTLRQQVEATERQIGEAIAQMAAVDVEAAEWHQQHLAEKSQLRAARSTLRTSAAALELRRSGAVRSPITGVVAGVNFRVGDAVEGETPFVSIAPPGRLVADLFLPTRSSAFVRVGQPVRLMIDAFPYERYGAISGTIERLSNVTLAPGGRGIPAGIVEPSYRMRVRMDRQAYAAYGRMIDIRPGMTLKASVVTDRRTISQWLFDPLLASGKNM